MTYDEAKEIMEKYSIWEDQLCSCHMGHPPCGKCGEMPSEEEYEEAGDVLSKTRIISAFPGCGKTYYYEYMAPLNESVLDSDSSKFSWLEDKKTRNPEFPTNYIGHIKENIGKVDVILVSSHAIVREALEEEGIDFTLVYPSRELKADYLTRYAERGSPQAFLDLINAKWDDFITQLENQKNCEHIVLLKDEFLLDRV